MQHNTNGNTPSWKNSNYCAELGAAAKHEHTDTQPQTPHLGHARHNRAPNLGGCVSIMRKHKHAHSVAATIGATLNQRPRHCCEETAATAMSGARTSPSHRELACSLSHPFPQPMLCRNTAAHPSMTSGRQLNACCSGAPKATEDWAPTLPVQRIDAVQP